MTPSILQTLARASAAKPQLDKLKKATDGFETMFVKSLVTELRKTSQNEFGDVPGSGIYDDMINDVLATNLSHNGRFGLSQAMYKPIAQLTLAQLSSPPTTTKP